MEQPNRNYEKEVFLFQQQLLQALSDKIMIQGMLDDALEELKEIREGSTDDIA